MPDFPRLSRRYFLLSGVGAVAVAGQRGTSAAPEQLLEQVPYGSVQFPANSLQQAQLTETHAVLMELEEDRLLKPYRVREGLPAPGPDMGGWYDADGFAPGHAYGQWLSALSRHYAITRDPATRAKIQRMVAGYASTIDPSGKFFVDNRFPAYIFDKLVCGLMDAHQFANEPRALPTLDRTIDAVSSHLPEKALTRPEMRARPHKNETYCWDESYTLPENLFLAWERSGNRRYRDMAAKYLLNEEYFYPLARGENVLPGKHAYSHVNALSSAAMAYLVLRNPIYLQAAKNGFSFVQEQSFATGGWGPNEAFVPPGTGQLGESLHTTHASFETPCGAYGHFKIARYLLRITKDPRYGDSMERVMYNTVLGAKPLQSNGAAFYYSDYNFSGRRVYFKDKWPCCSGTLPQIAADYRISTYFRDGDDVYVNLYIPSTFQWKGQSASLSLRQTGAYPMSGDVLFQVTASRPAEFTLYFRIPEWAGDRAVVAVNGKQQGNLRGGSFAAVRRAWKSGDRVELQMPMASSLEAVDAFHPQIAALVKGPVVLFALTDKEPSATATRAELLSAQQVAGTNEWRAECASGTLQLCPFSAVGDRPYSTYLRPS